MTRSTLVRTCLLLCVVVATAGCPSISPFNQKAYEQATSLKVEVLAIMDTATEPYSIHRTSVDAIRVDIEKAYEYAKGRPQNEDATKQWAIIKDPSRNSFAGFLKKWEGKAEETWKPGHENEKMIWDSFRKEAKGIISDDFDQIIELESGKRWITSVQTR